MVTAANVVTAPGSAIVSLCPVVHMPISSCTSLIFSTVYKSRHAYIRVSNGLWEQALSCLAMVDWLVSSSFTCSVQLVYGGHWAPLATSRSSTPTFSLHNVDRGSLVQSLMKWTSIPHSLHFINLSCSLVHTDAKEPKSTLLVSWIST